MAFRRTKRAAAEPPGPRRVLVVCDEPGAGELLARLLARAGNEVERARDLMELSDRLLVGRAVDAIVLDVVTGGIGGNLKLLDAVRNHREPAVAVTPVVMVAPHATSALFSWQAGADELLVRPFHADDLVAAVAAAVERPPSERVAHRRRQAEAARAGAPAVRP